MNKFNKLKKIKIPIIQRDYVQARKNDEKAEEVIDKFLEDMFSNLSQNKNFHLDFIYGYYDNDDYFIPIDGQQRLTTLFLLHYYLSKKEKKKLENKLTYETRTSSREFLEFLLKEMEINFEKEISAQIKNHKNFNPYWENDPTIYSMLKVLDKIDEKNKNREFNLNFDKLQNITFEIFEMEDFGEIQAEELYRKMNSRGKSLTQFENFKSIFEKIADSKLMGKDQKVAENFEKKWLPHFWPDDWNEEGVKKIDDNIMNFIRYITEMKFYETEKKEKVEINSFVFLEKFYKKEKNFNFLINDVLDNLETIKKLAKKVEDEFIFFDTDKKVNLFDEVINNKINFVHKTLFYLLILSLNEDYILDLLRIARNILHRKEVVLRKAGTISYDSTFNKEKIIKILPYLKQLINENNPYANLENIDNKKFNHEKEKVKYYLNKKKKLYKLEDYRYLKGDLRLLLSITDFDNLYKFIIEDEIFEDKNLNTTLRALLAIGDYSIKIGSVIKGSKYFFGNKGYMEILLTQNGRSENNKEIYKEFFEKLKESSLQKIIDNELKSYEDKMKDWRYYFIKYPVILSDKYSLKNVFGFMKGKNNKFLIEKLENITRFGNKHINVYLLALLEELNEKINVKGLKVYEDNIEYNKNIKIDVDNEGIEYKGKFFKVLGEKDFIEEIKKLKI